MLPGLGSPELIHKYLIEEPTRQVFDNGSYYTFTDDNEPVVYWCIQPGGKFNPDKYTLDPLDPIEIWLYLILDEKGYPKGEFRIKSIGSAEYMGTDKEENQLNEILNEIKRQKEIHAQEVRRKKYEVVAAAVKEFLNKASSGSEYLCVPIPDFAEEYVVTLELKQRKSVYRLKTYVTEIKRDITKFDILAFGDTPDKPISFLQREDAVKEIVNSIDICIYVFEKDDDDDDWLYVH